MIPIEVVINQVNRLYDNYSASASVAVREAKIKLVAKELSYMSVSRFVKVCDLLIRGGKSDTFPPIRDFVRLNAELPKDCEQVYYCKDCEVSGYYTVWQQRNGFYYRVMYRCQCNPSQSMPSQVLDHQARPKRAHNPYPPNDPLHERYNKRH